MISLGNPTNLLFHQATMWRSELLVIPCLLVFLIPCYTHSPSTVDCTVNGTYKGCAIACPETCQLTGKGPCVRECGGPCICKTGYIIDPAIPACVLRTDCPKDVIQKKGTTNIVNFNCFGRSPCKKK